MKRPRPGRYQDQARTYDLTRGASPTVVRLLARYLGPPAGRRLLDVAGGTGNYAQALQARGFDVVVLDVEPAMVRRSVAKIGRGRQVAADAAALPIGDRGADCAVMVQALHLLREPERALAEVRRVIREGPFVLQAYTEENLRPTFVFDYFPGGELPPQEHPPEERIEVMLHDAGFSGVEVERYVYLDTADGNLQALHTDAYRLAGPAYLRNTSFFQRLPEGVRREGLARLAEDLRSGVLEEKVRASFREAVRSGHGTVFAARP
jgi:SAM-dependent methyltransferase